MFVVNYESFYGQRETFGNFNTAFDAMKWMKQDVEWNIQNAKKNGVEITANTFNDGLEMEIPEYGKWFVSTVTLVGF